MWGYQMLTEVIDSSSIKQKVSSSEQLSSLQSTPQLSSADEQLLILLRAVFFPTVDQHMLDEKKQNTEQRKIIDEKTKLEKKDKDITIVLDDPDTAEKGKDEFKDRFLDITIKMLGFDRLHLQQYEQQQMAYKRFLQEYLQSSSPYKPITVFGSYSSYEKPVVDSTVVETLTFKEMREFTRAQGANVMLGTHANAIDPEVEARYKLWSIFTFNMAMGFLYTETWNH